MPIHRIYRVGSPYNATDLSMLDFEQTADVMYLAHTNYPPTKLIRTSHANWAFNTLTFGPLISPPASVTIVADNPNQDASNSGNAYFPMPASYVITAYNEVTGQESRASPSASATNDLALKRNKNTISWPAVTGATAYRIYKSENTQSFGYIGTTTALSFVDINIGPDLSEGPPAGDDPFSGSGKYPGTITFHEQRSIWGRTTNIPNGIWASKSADFENMDFSRPVRADDAFQISLVANKVNAIQQLVSSKVLLALTNNNIFVVEGSNADYLSATPPPRVRPEISRGASALNPLTIDTVTFYQTAIGCSVRTIGYEFQKDGYSTNDVTIYSPHLFEGFRIVDWAFAAYPGSCIYAVRSDGKMLCFTWEQEQEVWGWTLLETDGLFKAVTCISENGEDRAYVAVERTIGGVAKLYIERLASDLWTDQRNACYLDCSRTVVNAVPSATIDRLDHLEGRTVSALADGNVVNGLTVSGGKVTLPFVAGTVTVGLPFSALIETLPLAVQGQGGWTVAKPQQAGQVAIRMVDTRGVEAGPDEEHMYPVKDREAEAYGMETNLFTGDRIINLAGISGNEVRVVVRSVDPLPFQITGIFVDDLASRG